MSVKAGFARNYLIPKGIAVAATPRNMVDFESRREELERREAEALAAAGKQAAALEDVEITVIRKAGENGRLFGSVGSADVTQALADLGHEVVRQQVRMPEGEPVRQLGEYVVGIHVDADVDASIKLKVEAESVEEQVAPVGLTVETESAGQQPSTPRRSELATVASHPRCRAKARRPCERSRMHRRKITRLSVIA